MRWYQYKRQCPSTPDHEEFVTLNEDAAAAQFRFFVQRPWLSNATALEGFISSKNAWPVAAPTGKAFDFSAYMAEFVARSRGIERAAKKIGVDAHFILDVIEGKRAKMPAHVLRKLGLKATVVLAPADATA